MSDEDRLAVPETSRISGLLSELKVRAKPAVAVAPSALVSEQSPPPQAPQKRVRRARPLRGLRLGEVLDRINWHNDPDRARPSWLEPILPGGKRFRPAGSLPVAQVFGLINWNNANPGPQWPVCGEEASEQVVMAASVGSVLAGINWGD